MFNRILEMFSVPIMILNFGGIVGGIWLALSTQVSEPRKMRNRTSQPRKVVADQAL